MPLQLITPPTDPCMDLSVAKAHLRVDGTFEDTLIESYVAAAEQEAEAHMCRALMPQTWQLVLDAFPSQDGGLIRLRRPPVSAVTKIMFLDTNGAEQTLDPSAYKAYLSVESKARVGPVFGGRWPSTRIDPEAVKIEFTCGYADESKIPELIKAWIKLRIGTLYTTRESDVLERGADAHLGFADFMLDRYTSWDL